MAPRRREVPGRHRASSGKVVSPHRLRRLHRARAGRRGPGPRLRDVAGPSGSSTRPRSLDVGDDGRGGRARHRPEGQAHRARHEADRAEPLDAARGQVPDRLRHQGQGPQHHRLRHLRRRRGGHRRPGARRPTSPGPSASSTRARCSRRATRSRRWCSTSTSRTSASASASSSSRRIPWDDAVRAPPGRHARQGQGHQGHRLRRLRRDRAGHRGSGPRLRAARRARREPARRGARRPRRSRSRSSTSTPRSARWRCPSRRSIATSGEDDYREYLRKQGDGRGAPRRRDGEVQPPQGSGSRLRAGASTSQAARRPAARAGTRPRDRSPVRRPRRGRAVAAARGARGLLRTAMSENENPLPSPDGPPRSPPTPPPHRSAPAAAPPRPPRRAGVRRPSGRPAAGLGPPAAALRPCRPRRRRAATALALVVVSSSSAASSWSSSPSCCSPTAR